MKIWIDILTPKQTLFFNGIAGELIKRNYDVFITIRRFRETNALYRRYIQNRYRNYVVGRYGGKELKSKLLASISRMKKLIRIVEEEKPDLAISFTSPDAARVSYGLGIKHVSVSDTPHAEAASKLSIPLSIRLYTPWVIDKKRWTGYGIDPTRIYQYKGLDPIVWLNRQEDDPSTMKIISRIQGQYLIIRPIEWMASYQLDTDYNKMINLHEMVKEIMKIAPELKIIILPRYSIDVKKYKTKYRSNPNVYIPTKPVDGPTLVKYSIGLIGYGGTMTVESALLGKLTITVRPGKQPEYIEYLINEGIVYQCTEIDEVIEKMNEHRAKGYEDIDVSEVLAKMEDPAVYIAETIEELE